MAGLAAACSDAAGPDPVLLEVVAGDGQEAQVGTPVADPLVVHVMRLDSLPRAGIPVDWTVLEGGGVVEPSAASSDAEGTVQASWMLGSEPGQQVVRVTAGGEGVDLRAWATPPPPEEWSEVIEIRPVAEIEGETLLASVRLYNRWPGTLQLTTMTGCITPWEYPALYAGTGERVARANFACTFAVTTRRVPQADSLGFSWSLNIASAVPGDYTLRFKFAVVEINGAPGTLPDVETTVYVRD